MRNDVFGIIYTGEENINLRELVDVRSAGALPVGGRYRALDFVLSNMVNSGIRLIGVIPRKNYHSLMDHLGSGKEWDLNRKKGGLLIIPPYDTIENTGSYFGLTDTLKGANAFMRRAPQRYCLLATSCNIYTDTYDAMFDFHTKMNADITVMYDTVDSVDACVNQEEVKFSADETGRVTEMSTQNPNHPYMSTGAILLKKDLLQYLVGEAVSRGHYHLSHDLLMGNLASLKIYGYQHKGYVGRINSVASYHQVNMDFLKPRLMRDLFHTGNMVYTKIKDEAPTKYSESSAVSNCLVGSGCVIEGNVENSIIFRGVHIAKDVVIKNSVIMQDSEIYAGSRLNNVILDKKVSVRPNSILAGSRIYPVVIPKGANV